MTSLAVPGRAYRLRDRLAAAFLLVLMLFGTFALWVGVPAGCLWLIGHVTESTATAFIAVLVLIPTALVVVATALAWMNRLYLRVTAAARPEPVRARGPLEMLVVWSLIAAILAITVWFFFFAHTTLLVPTTW
jgi:hypothetical protein